LTAIELQAIVSDKEKADVFFSTHPLHEQWKRVREEVEPHYLGKPPKFLKEAFPNEPDDIRDYRLKIYRSKTKSIILEAFDEIFRLFSSAKYNVKSENTDFLQWRKTFKIENLSVDEWVFRHAYTKRVVDPNGFCVCLPVIPEIPDPTVQLDVNFELIGSDRIVNFGPDYLIYRKASTYVPKTETEKHLSDITKGREVVILTDNDIFEATFRDGQWFLSLYYTHGMGRVPAVKLGGRTLSMRPEGYLSDFTFDVSDFDAAVPLLDTFDVYSNQLTAVTVRYAFPITIINGETCSTCSGTGQVPYTVGEETKMQPCGGCKGHGQTFFTSPLAGYRLRPKPKGMTVEEKVADAQQKPIDFTEAPTGTMSFLAEMVKESKKNAETALSIRLSTGEGQSGVAKEIDREVKYVKLGRIADYVYDVLLKSLLEFAHGYRFIGTTPDISVIKPVSFDIKTESDLAAEYQAAMTQPSTGGRAETYLDYVGKRFAGDEKLIRVNELCVKYTSFFLLTSDEKMQNILLYDGYKTEAIKATEAHRVFSKLSKEEKFDNMADEELFAKADEMLKPLLDKAASFAARVQNLSAIGEA
jgi:hypothetical protein